MQDLCQMLCIQKLNAMVYHHECNGMVEHFNRTLKTMPCKHAAKQWDRFLPGVLYTYHNAPNTRLLEKNPYGTDLCSPTEAAYFLTCGIGCTEKWS